MPNWCYTSYVCIGSERDTRDLYEKMRALSKRTASLLPNDFGKEWMGNVVAALGGKWQDIACRGEFSGLELDNDGVLRFSVMSAWVELSEVRQFIESCYPNLKMFYYAEESGSGYYVTNDVVGRFFPDRYILEFEDGEPMYFETLGEMLREVSEIAGTMCKSEDDLLQFLRQLPLIACSLKSLASMYNAHWIHSLPYSKFIELKNIQYSSGSFCRFLLLLFISL